MKREPKVSVEEIREIKAATRRVYEFCGPLTAVAEIARVQKSVLSKYGAPQEDHVIRLDVAVACDRECGEPVMLRMMAALEGYDLAPRPGGGSSDRRPAAVSPFIGRLIREVADVSAVIIEAEADGSFSPKEYAASMIEIDEAYAALGAVRDAMRARANG